MKFVNQLKAFRELLEDLNASTSTLFKIDVIKRKADDQMSMELLRFANDPSVTFGVTKKKWVSTINEDYKSFVIESDDNIDFLLLKLIDRELTGNDAIGLISTMVSLIEVDERESLTNVLLDIIDKNLGVRIGSKEINKAVPNLIAEFSVALAEKFHDKKNSELVNVDKFYVSQKLDGLRIIIIKDRTEVSFKSRTGKDILTLQNYIPEILKVFGETSKIVLDGEVLNFSLNAEDSFKNVMSQINRKGHQIEDCNLCLFDYLPINVFYGIEKGFKFGERIETLNQFKNIANGTRIVIVDQIEYTPETFEDMKQTMFENGWEGLMLRKDDIYKGKRSKDILKYKEFFDEELECVGVETTTKMMVVNGANVEVPCMGSAIVNFGGFNVGVGSGWTDEQRIKFYHNPEELIGNLLTIRYKQVLKTDGRLSLQFPVVKCIHGKTREV
jgi:DNA ligase-1